MTFGDHYICCTCGAECPGGKFCPVCEPPEPKRLLFLDIDGVLNSNQWFKTRKDHPDWPQAQEQGRKLQEAQDIEGYTIHERLWQLDPGAVEVLIGIVEEHNLQVVVSSTWRRHPVSHLTIPLAKRGFHYPILGRTPITVYPLVDLPNAPKPSEFIRGLEIEHWILTNVPRHQWGGLRIVILDDSSDMGRLRPWLVHTDYRTGLVPHDALQVPDALAEPLDALLATPNPLWNDKARELLYGPEPKM